MLDPAYPGEEWGRDQPLEMLLRMFMDDGLTKLAQLARDGQDGGAHHSAEAEA